MMLRGRLHVSKDYERWEGIMLVPLNSIPYIVVLHTMPYLTPFTRRRVFSKVWLHLCFSKVWLDPPSRFLVTVIIFGLLNTKSVNCHSNRRGHGRHPRNCRLTDDVLNLNMSTVTGIAEGRVATLVTVDVFGHSHLLGVSEVSTVTGISGCQGRHPRNCRRF